MSSSRLMEAFFVFDSNATCESFHAIEAISSGREALTEGDGAVVTEFESQFETHRRRLKRAVQFRLDARLRRRIDPSDVVQECYLEAAQRLTEYLRHPTMPFYLWLRFLAIERIVTLHRKHLGVQARDVRREINYRPEAWPAASTANLAAKLLGKLTSPSLAAVRAELKSIMCEALDQLSPLDREIIALRHFEQMNTAEVAQVIGISESGASSRYIRALRRLKSLLSKHSELADD